MHPILFTFPQFIPLLGGKSIHVYGLMIALGFLIGMWWIKRESKRVGVDPQKSLDLAFYTIIAGLIGSRIFYVFQTAPNFWDDPLVFFRIWEGGLVFQGGVIGAMIVGIWLVKKNKMPYFTMADIFAPALAFGHGLGRIGCFFAGCCHGKECPPDFPLRVIFPDIAQGIAPAGVPLYPTQLMEVVGEAIIVTILLTYRKKKKFNGAVILLYLILYSVLRIGVEYFRGDTSRGFIIEPYLSNGQFFALVLIAVAVGCWVYLRRKLTMKN